MSWANGKNTLICEECGREADPKEFYWVLGEIPICKNGSACHYRQELQGQRPAKPSWFKTLTFNLKRR